MGREDTVPAGEPVEGAVHLDPESHRDNSQCDERIAYDDNSNSCCSSWNNPLFLNLYPS